jgi:hypothetical protein
MQYNNTTFFNTTTENNIYQNLCMIDWLDIKWDIHSNAHYATIRDINDNFVNLSVEQLNTFAFPDLAIDRNTQTVTHNPINLYIPSCGCNSEDCDSYTKVECNMIYTDTPVMNVLNFIYLEYQRKKVKLTDLCKNDLCFEIKSALTRLCNNEDVYLGEIMCDLTSFQEFRKYNNDYYLILKRNSIYEISTNFNNNTEVIMTDA